MRNKVLGLISFLLSGMILYVFLNDIIGNLLIPSMQRYLIVSGVFLVFVGFVLLFSREKEKIKVSDFLLLLPIFFLLFVGDGKLTTTFANNRSNTFKGTSIEKKSNKKDIKEKREENIEVVSKDYSEVDFKNVDFDVKNTTFAGLSDGITYNRNPEKLVGKTIRVRGFAVLNAEYLPDGVFAIGKYLISCCAADAEVTGFMAVSDEVSSLKENAWYEVEGVLELGEDTYGNQILMIRVLHYKKISGKTESTFVYPCYAYGDGSCKQILDYQLN